MVHLSSFKVSSYPDGHKHIVSDKDLHGDTELVVSIRSFDDLFLASQAKLIHPELTHLRINYLLAGRCDRRFSPGEALDLKIVCDYINSMGWESISILKPHSKKTLELLQAGSYSTDLTDNLIRSCRDHIFEQGDRIDTICHVSPDEGASKWIDQYNLRNLIQGQKKRDADGKVTGVDFGSQLLRPEIADCKNFVIIDDLCDGGATFIAIAKEIHLQAPQAKVYLVVTHAIFSKGLEPFEGHIEKIFCTNSFADFDHPRVMQYKL